MDTQKNRLSEHQINAKADSQYYAGIFFLSRHARLDKKKIQRNIVNKWTYDSLPREDSNQAAHLQH